MIFVFDFFGDLTCEADGLSRMWEEGDGCVGGAVQTMYVVVGGN